MTTTSPTIQQARLRLPVDLAALQREVRGVSGWQDHFNSAHYTGRWTVISLRSPGGRTDNIIPDQIDGSVYADTYLMDFCPEIRAFLDGLPCEKMSVRLLNLAAGATIKTHRDHELSFEQGEARLHIPLFTNSGVCFCLNEVLLHMDAGSCWYINANLPHSVVNNGATDRIHLVIDCKVNDWLREQFAAAADIRHVPEDLSATQKVVAELRRLQTPASMQLADKLEGKTS